MARRRQRLIDRRKILGLSQERLADAVGVDRNTVGRWETVESSPQPTQRPRLADVLGVSFEHLQELLLDIVHMPEHDGTASPTESGVVIQRRPNSPDLPPPTLDAGATCLSPQHWHTVSDPWAPELFDRNAPGGAPESSAWFGVRTAHLIGTVDNWPGPGAQSDGLQSLLDREFLMFDAIAESQESAPTVSRRQALITIAALPLTLAAPNAGLRIQDVATESFLSRCAASLTACWHLLRGSDLYTIDHVLSAYLLKLEAITKHLSPHQDEAARLASQAHRICGIVALHRNQLRIREYHCKQALHYATATSDTSTRVSALISLASTYFYDADPAHAATIYEQALALESGLPLLQRSRIHAELSVVYAQLGRELDALGAAELAEQLYPRYPEQDPSFLYAEFTKASLTLEHGLSYLALAERLPGREYQCAAAEVFARAEQTAAGPVPDRIRFEIINHQAHTAVLMNDLDAFETYLGRALDGVILLGSKQRQKEMQMAWRRAGGAWPNDKRLKALGEQLQPAIGQ